MLSTRKYDASLTLTTVQIKDIMEGREPQPPEDWDDTIDPAGSDDDGSATAESDATGPIGGPASEH
jgi:cell division protease FtsH